MKNKFYQYIQNLQDQIVGLEAVEGQPNSEKTFGNVQGGGGRTRVIENGNVIEKAVSIFQQSRKIEAMQKMFNVGEADFLPGLSLAFHPMAPTVHANWRYFEMYDDNGNVIQQWFVADKI
jgi:coproporphyrinogen III oxidase